MPAPRKYPPELRERSIRLVLEAREQEPSLSLNAAVTRIGPRVGVNPDTLRTWCKQAEIDLGRRPGVSTDAAAEVQPDFGETVESVQSNLTLEVMQELNARVDIDKEDPAEAAEAYLKEFGYIE